MRFLKRFMVMVRLARLRNRILLIECIREIRDCSTCTEQSLRKLREKITEKKMAETILEIAVFHRRIQAALKALRIAIKL